MPATLLATALVALSLGQSLESYGGTWIAEFKGTAFVRLELSVSGGTLGGRIALGDMEVDADGRVKAARQAPDRLTPIFDVAVRNSVVSFSHKDGNDTDRFELRLIGGEGELRFILDEDTLKELTDEGIPPPKPVQLKRVAR
jgi:hypothetical protein